MGFLILKFDLVILKLLPTIIVLAARFLRKVLMTVLLSYILCPPMHNLVVNLRSHGKRLYITI